MNDEDRDPTSPCGHEKISWRCRDCIHSLVPDDAPNPPELVPAIEDRHVRDRPCRMNESTIPKVTGQALLDFLERPTHRSPMTVHNCRTYVRKILAAAYGEAWHDHPFTQADVRWQMDHFAAAATIGSDSIRSYQAGYSSLVADYFAWVATSEPVKTSMKRVIAEMHAFERARRAKLAALLPALLEEFSEGTLELENMLDRLGEALR